ncbi:MAG TPA: aspartate aminotransferase family protein [Candidatus Nanopelagicales bacterium]|nr:aspartate aminotransferase family protein [Candidatus Nanopelagicales bacterium]
MTSLTYTADELDRGRRAMLGGWQEGEGQKPVFVRASGSSIWDDAGREFLDLTSQAWSNNVGASDPRVVAAANEQALELTHLRSNYDSIPQLVLASRLTATAPADLTKVSFCLHGSLAVESAIKLALKNSSPGGQIIALTDGYHGRSLATMALSWPHYERSFDHMTPGVLRVQAPYAYRAPAGVSPEEWAARCAEQLRSTIKGSAFRKPAAFIMEPVQGNGAQLDFPHDYYRYVREICTELDVLLIWDEIQTGYGRTGEMWAADHYGVTPDIIVFGKGAGGGYPLAGIIARDDLEGFAPGDDALTFGQFPVSLAAGIATLDVLESDKLIENAAEIGRYATAALQGMQARHEIIGDVRCPGLLIGVELVTDRATKEPATKETIEVYERGLERGVIFGSTKYAGLGNVIKFKPPLCITREEMDRALNVFDDVLTSLQ